MSWEQRGKHRYFFTAERRNAKVVKHYWPGEAGEAMAKLVEQARKDRADKQQAELAVLARLDRIDRSLDEFAELSRTAIEAVALINGFHYHRGEWRQKRGDVPRSTETTS